MENGKQSNVEREKLRILVVDDDENEREAAKIALGKDYKLDTVGCYNDMRNLMYDWKYDVVLTNNGLREDFGGTEITCAGFGTSNPYMSMVDFIASVNRWGGGAPSDTNFNRIKYPEFFAILTIDYLKAFKLDDADSRSWFNRQIERNRKFEIVEQIGSDLSYAPRKVYNLDGTIATILTGEDLPLSYFHRPVPATLTDSPERIVRDDPIMVKNWEAGLETLLSYDKNRIKE